MCGESSLGRRIHSRYLTRNDLLLHLLGQSVLQGEVIPSIDEELVLEMLGRVEVFTGWLLSVTPALNTVVAGSDPAVLDLHVSWRVRELALRVAPCALLSLELATHLELEPPRVLLIEQVVDVEHGESVGGQVGGVGHSRG